MIKNDEDYLIRRTYTNYGGRKMCEYCLKRTNNKGIKDVDKDDTEFAQVVVLRPENPMLYVEIEGEDEDGYKPSDFFPINYCPMCR